MLKLLKFNFFMQLSICMSIILGCQLEAEHFPFVPPKVMYLIPGMELVNHPVTTNNPEAQRFLIRA